MFDIITSIIENCVPIYNKMYFGIYDIYDIYDKNNYTNTDTNTNTNTDTNTDDNIYYSNNFVIDYFCTSLLVFYYTITIFMSIVFIKHANYLNTFSSIMNDTKTINDTVADTVIDETVIDETVIDETVIDDDKKLYLHSLIEITQNNSDIMSKLKTNTNYIVIMRVKLKHYVQMKNTKYELHSKYKKYNTTKKDFITKDMYMIMGFNFNNQHTNFATIIVAFINHLNSISEEKYKNEDFLIIAIGSVNENIINSFVNGIVNIKYELFNLIDVIFNLKNNNFIKYTLTLPIIRINNMILDMFSDTIFISRHYSIDKHNYERWNGILLNDIKDW